MARIPYVDPDGASPDVRAALEAMPSLNIFRMLANADTAFVPFVRFAGALLTQLELDEKLRELAILLTAAHTEAEYEWIQHEGISRAMGITEEQIAAVKRGDLEDDSLDEHARVLLRFAADTLDDGRASDETFAAMRERYPPRQIVEVLLVIGTYQALARVMTTLEIDLDAPLGSDIIDQAKGRLADR